jgi:hypothetical protein
VNKHGTGGPPEEGGKGCRRPGGLEGGTGDYVLLFAMGLK